MKWPLLIAEGSSDVWRHADLALPLVVLDIAG